VVTVDGTYLVGMITAVVCGMVMISHVGTDVGTSVYGMITGLGGNVGTTMTDDLGILVGMLFGVTTNVVCNNVYGTVGTVTYLDDGTVVGTTHEWTITLVVCGIVTIDDDEINGGKTVGETITGLVGNEVTTMTDDLGILVGMLSDVTIIVVYFFEYDNVGNGAIDVKWIVVGTFHVWTITPVVPGMITIDVDGTLNGTSVIGMITGLVGICVTTMYDVVGFDGILLLVTIGVVNLTVYGVTGNE